MAFHQLDRKSGARIKYKRVSAKTGREVDYDNIVKGYELEGDRYVVIDPDELEAMDPKATNTIDLEEFVDLESIDPIYYEHTYYLSPGKGGDKAYALLQKAMEEQGKVGIGKVVIRTKQYLAAIRPIGKALALHTMLFGDEVIPLSEIDGIPDRMPKVGDRERQMARKLIDSLSAEFDPDRYEDEYRERVLKLIRDKAKGKTISVEEVEETPKVIDLIEALKASVDQAGERRPASRKRRRSA